MLGLVKKNELKLLLGHLGRVPTSNRLKVGTVPTSNRLKVGTVSLGTSKLLDQKMKGNFR